MSVRLQELADIAGARLQGDPDCLISGLATLDSAGPSDLSFLTSESYIKQLRETQAAAVLMPSAHLAEWSLNALVAENPRLCLAKIAHYFEKDKSSESIKPGVHSTAVVGPGCSIHPSASIGPHVVIGAGVSIAEAVVVGATSVIGDNVVICPKTVLKSNVTLYDRIRVGESCLIHSGVVIGSDGFGFAHDGKTWVKMPHLGSVVVGDKVEIGANTTIDRGFLDDTIIGNGVIIDNLVQVAHNVTIGENTAIAACVAIAGSTSIGKNCLIGGGACIAGHLEITDRVSLTATTGVNHSINEPGVYSAGLPAKPNHIWRRNAARFQYLDDMAKRIRTLEKALQQKEESKTR